MEQLRDYSFSFMCFILWAHGIKYLDEVIEKLEQDKDWEILYIKKIENFSPHTFINKIYGCDTYPLEHLESKISYLKKLPAEAVFIFVKCFNPQYIIEGEHPYRTWKSVKMTNFKNYFRRKYNPSQPDGSMSHDHIIHGTDYEKQTDYLLKTIGIGEGVSIFVQDTIFKIPHHIPHHDSYRIKLIETSRLYANILKKTNEKVTLELAAIKDTPHYMGIKDIKIYRSYFDRFKYTYLCDYYSVPNFIRLQQKDIREILKQAPIIIKSINDTPVILDGVHRAAVALWQNQKNVLAMELI